MAGLCFNLQNEPHKNGKKVFTFANSAFNIAVVP